MFRVLYSAETHDKNILLMQTNKLVPLLLLSLVIAGMFACTTKKDGFTYRVFHNTTARYNGYFYAKEAIKEGQANIVKAHLEDYDAILPIFIYGDETSAQSSFAEMERAIEKSSLVIERHKMDVPSRSSKKKDRPEINKWIDDNYLLIGKSYFFKRNYFKAEEMFLFVTRKYKEKEMQARGNAWLARAYMETEQWTKAKNTLLKIEQIKEIEDEDKADIHLVFADYYIRQEDYKNAAEQIEKALRYIKKKKDRARPTFILAQLMQQMNRSQDAISYYETVLTLRPEYEMEFYARINQAMAYDRRGGNADQIKEQLLKMLKDDKNIEYRDQIYYALAELELEDRNRENGIDYLLLSLAEPNGKPKQRTKSFLRLADLYLEDRDYQDAQAYYDSTFQSINEDHPRYLDVKNKAESLTDLVENLLLIEHEDSLQNICALSDEDKVKKMKSVIADMREELQRQEEERQRRMAALAAGDAGAASQGDFWPWNPQLKAIGKQNFDNYWGSRPLEDNWRRKNKLQQSFGDGEETVETPEEAPVETGTDIESQLPSVDELLAGLPCAEAQIVESDKRIAEAFYNAGVVYKEKLDDVENAIERWEVLVTRYDDSDVHPTAYYQLYRTYLYREQEEGYSNPFCGTCNSPYWSDIILDKYPGSDWARLIQNPGFEDIAEIEKAEQHAAYEALYNRYSQRAYQEVILKASEVITNEPNNNFLCKYRILKAFAVGNMDAMTGSTASYINELKEVIASCPETEEAILAKSIIDNINGEAPPVVEEVPDAPKEEEEIFDYDPTDRHYFAVIFPVEGGGDVNNVKALVSDFDTKYFKSSALKVSSNLLDRQNQIVLVKTFNKLEDAKNYYTTFLNNDNELKDINSGGYTLVLISKNNYVTLFKSKEVDAYQSFFERNYKL